MFLLRSGFGLEVLVNIFLPWVIYVFAQPEMGRIHALMVSMLPPIAWSALQLALKRRIDALSVLVVTGIVLSLLAFLGGGSFRVLELREHLVTGVMGLVFLGSVAIKRPMLGVIIRSVMVGKSQSYAAKLQRRLDDRRGLTFSTLGIGSLMLIQAAIAIGLVFTLPVREFLIVTPIINYVLIGLFVGLLLYTKHRARAASVEAEHDQREPAPRQGS